MFWIKDPKDNKPSVSLTLLMVGFITVLVKLIFAGMSYKEFTFGPFSASDFGLAISPLAALYWGRRLPNNKENK